MGDPVDGDGLGAGGAVLGDPTGAVELLVGVGEGLGVCDGLGEPAGRDRVPVGVGFGAAGEVVVADWPAPADVSAGVTGRTRK